MARSFNSSYVRGHIVLWSVVRCDKCREACACTEGVIPLPLTTTQMNALVPLPKGGFYQTDDGEEVLCTACYK